MPYAWFMGEIDFFTDIMEASTEALDAEIMMRPLRELANGLILFPMAAKFVPVWKDWYKYLLPYALSAPDITTIDGTLQDNLLMGCFSLYPQAIVEEYPGFRDDLVYTLGTRAIPVLLDRDNPRYSDDLQNPLFNDIWDLVDSAEMEKPGEVLGLPMLFCLKYLFPTEIPSWVQSLITIERPQWRLAIITWWLNLSHFLEIASNWPADGNCQTLIEAFFTRGITKHQSFTSLDDFIPLQNLSTLHEALSRYLTRDIFQMWSADIMSHPNWVDGDTSFPVGDSMANIKRSLDEFESRFYLLS